MGEEIFDPLGRGGVIPAAKVVGRVLQLPLECDARKGIAGREILRRDGDEQSAVDVLSVARKLMPFVTTRPASLAAATTCPPGQTQNENTPRPFSVWQESLYDVGGRP